MIPAPLIRWMALGGSLLCWVVLLWSMTAMAGCAGVAEPARGSAQDQAARAAGRAESTTAAADAAAVEAARAKAEAEEKARQAKADPTEAKIEAAAVARIEAASAAAVADALRQVSADATAAAERAAVKGAEERKAEDEAAADRRWLSTCRWIAASCLLVAALAGGALWWLVSWKVGSTAAGILATAGVVVGIYGRMSAWSPSWALAALVAAGALWVYHHHRHRRGA